MRKLSTLALALVLLTFAALLPMEIKAMEDQRDNQETNNQGASSRDQSQAADPQAQAPAEDWREIAPTGTALVMKMQAAPGSRDAGMESIALFPVYSDDPASANKQWAAATPSGGLQATINNPAAMGRITPGDEYFIFVVPADPAKRG